jgi:hypothetical protein
MGLDNEGTDFTAVFGHALAQNDAQPALQPADAVANRPATQWAHPAVRRVAGLRSNVATRAAPRRRKQLCTRIAAHAAADADPTRSLVPRSASLARGP